MDDHMSESLYFTFHLVIARYKYYQSCGKEFIQIIDPWTIISRPVLLWISKDRKSAWSEVQYNQMYSI
jgi:hypothetical protein